MKTGNLEKHQIISQHNFIARGNHTKYTGCKIQAVCMYCKKKNENSIKCFFYSFITSKILDGVSKFKLEHVYHYT